MGSQVYQPTKEAHCFLKYKNINTHIYVQKLNKGYQYTHVEIYPLTCF